MIDMKKTIFVQTGAERRWSEKQHQVAESCCTDATEF